MTETQQITGMITKSKKVAVVGSRGYDDFNSFSAQMKNLITDFSDVCFVSGGCKTGADALIEKFANTIEVPILVFYPNYSEHNRRAPLIRNKQIVDASDYLIAFWDGQSTGTAHTIELAKQKQIPIRIINI